LAGIAYFVLDTRVDDGASGEVRKQGGDLAA